MSGHLNPLCVNSTPDEDPRNERVGVPHFARTEFVASPNHRRNVWNQSEHSPSDVCVLGNALWAFNCFVDVRNYATTPAAHLVAEEPKSASGSAADGALGDDTAPFAALPDRSLLDHETAFGQVDNQRRVVEVASAPVRKSRSYRFEDLSVHANGVSPGAERQPVKVDRTLGLFAHRGHLRLAAWHSRSFE
jgi:hypothetical protein